jgi:hypothetical protein
MADQVVSSLSKQASVMQIGKYFASKIGGVQILRFIANKFKLNLCYKFVFLHLLTYNIQSS